MARPDVRDALAAALPDLDPRISSWLGGGADRRLERTLARVLLRMSGRATPFALYATTTTGTVGAATALELGDRVIACSRFAPGWLASVAERTEPGERPVRPNDTALLGGGRWRYTRRSGRDELTHLAVADEPWLRAALRRAPRLAELGEDGAKLARIGLLEYDDEPSMTVAGGERPSALVGLDEAQPGQRAAAVRALAAAHGAEPRELIAVDALRPARAAVLGESEVAELAAGIELLAALTEARPAPRLAAWQERFAARYERERVGLLEALDPELGIGPPALAPPQLAWEARDVARMQLIDRARRGGAIETELTAADLEALLADRPRSLPVAISAWAVLADGEDGRRDIHLIGGSGPASVRLLGRFCLADPDLRAAVAEHVRTEERLCGDAIVAEVVHRPDGPLAAIAERPLLHEHEIAVLGRGSAPQQLRLDELVVCLRDDRLELSTADGRVVLPRLSTAHDFNVGGPPAYRLLGMLQDPDGSGSIAWSWGALIVAPFLPRIRFGRLVLALARWRLAPPELAAVRAGGGAALLALRGELGLPRHVSAGDGDRRVPGDLDDPAQADVLAAVLASAEDPALVEVWPPPERLALRGPEGRHVHEVVVPFACKKGDSPLSFTTSPAARAVARFPPGSEWTSLALYCGPAEADAVLLETFAPLARATGAPWFFLRYSDPDRHLRVRVRSAAARAELEAAAAALLDAGRLHRVATTTYEREIDRYGGPRGIEFAEAAFHRSSELAIDTLAALPALDDPAARRRAAVLGVDALLDALGLDGGAALALLASMRGPLTDADRTELAASFRVDRPLLLAAQRPRVERFDVPDLTRPLRAVAGSLVHMHINRLLRADHARGERIVCDHAAMLRLARAARDR